MFANWQSARTNERAIPVPNGSIVRSLRVISGCALVGAVTAGALFGWAPALLGMFSVHEVGAALGVGVGVVANARHMI